MAIYIGFRLIAFAVYIGIFLAALTAISVTVVLCLEEKKLRQQVVLRIIVILVITMLIAMGFANFYKDIISIPPAKIITYVD